MAEDDFVREVVASCKARPLNTLAASSKHDILQVPKPTNTTMVASR